MRPEHPHTFADVTVVDRTEFGWLCQIENRCVFVDKHQVEPETPIPSPGERGPLTIAAPWVEEIRAAIRERRPRYL